MYCNMIYTEEHGSVKRQSNKLLISVLDRAECERWIAKIDTAMDGSPILCGSLCMPAIHADLSEVVRRAIKGNFPCWGEEDVLVSARWFYTRYDTRKGKHGTVEMQNHADGTVWIEGPSSDKQRTRSNVTLLLYLNDNFEGGMTTFMSGPPPDAVPTRSVVPEPGKALLIRQDAWHRGDRVTSGVKYLMRTDISLPHCGLCIYDIGYDGS